MSLQRPFLKLIVAAFLLLVTFSLPLHAQEQRPAADLTDEAELLERLAGADKAEAAHLDRQLQALWRKSGSSAMDLLLRRGRDAIEVGDADAALEHLTALTDHAPDFAEGWHARASVYFEKEMYGPAVSDLERALFLNPNNYNAIFGLGTILETFEDYDRAFDAYQRALTIHPHHEDVLQAVERVKTKVDGQAL
ncbi:tetratricopeptide repeat protein [Thalassococcus sp. S3]|uniref:tetratricopeptide repeat protein n=1 Tax=Thalassococcus sp. S3 TaxID=2017482 RepID=UPI001024432F|nr:tetratricopeptide repeat protein [Thalassococcus sp. S3]QBF32433.1 hypothetical protein CFI11_14590 [Thalassococcus sp. S3]